MMHRQSRSLQCPLGLLAASDGVLEVVPAPAPVQPATKQGGCGMAQRVVAVVKGRVAKRNTEWRCFDIIACSLWERHAVVFQNFGPLLFPMAEAAAPFIMY